MQSKEPRHPSTVFDLPPRETEARTAREVDAPSSTLGGAMDMPSTTVLDTPKAMPEPDSFEGPAFEEVGYADDTFSKDSVSPWSEGALDWTESDADAPGKKGAKADARASAPESRPASVREDQDKVAQLGLAQRDNASAAASSRNANFRRPRVGRIIAITLLVNLLTLAGAGYWFYRHFLQDLDHRLASQAAPAPAIPSPRSENTVPPDTGDSAKLKTEVAGLGQRLASMEQQSQAQIARLEELSRALADTRNDLKAKDAAASKPASPPLENDLPPTQGELVLLKERNRLTAYADESIATGARAPYERLWEALDDPRLANLVHAATAEILRVQNYYLSGSRLERYDIPVATYFPADAALKDSQLKDGQLIKLLHERKNPWEVRVKAAFLLGTRRSMEVGDALVETVRHDDNLDVVKEATFSFEQMTGHRSRLFDAAAMEQWWKKYKATPTPPQPAPAKAQAVAPDSKGGDAKAGAPKEESKGSGSKKSQATGQRR